MAEAPAFPRRGTDGGLLLRVFTHPACAGCGPVVDRAWQLTRKRPELELRTVSLTGEQGLAEAKSERIKTIPTVILSAGDEELERWVGTPVKGALEAAVEARGLAAAV